MTFNIRSATSPNESNCFCWSRTRRFPFFIAELLIPLNMFFSQYFMVFLRYGSMYEVKHQKAVKTQFPIRYSSFDFSWIKLWASRYYAAIDDNCRYNRDKQNTFISLLVFLFLLWFMLNALRNISLRSATLNSFCFFYRFYFSTVDSAWLNITEGIPFYVQISIAFLFVTAFSITQQ